MKTKTKPPELDKNGVRCMTTMESAALYNVVTFYKRGEPQLFGPFAQKDALGGIVGYLWTWKAVNTYGRVLSVDFMLLPEDLANDLTFTDMFSDHKERTLKLIMEALK